MSVRLTRHARQRALQRRIPIHLIRDVFTEPDDVRPSLTTPGREIRARIYDDDVIEIVIDVADERVVTVWRKKVR